MDKIGPMCRSVEDCVLVLNAIYGSDGKDDTVHRRAVRLEPGAAAGVAADRLHPEGIRRRAEQSQSDRRAAPDGRARARRCTPTALDVFRKAGAKLEPMAMPDFPNQAIGFVLSAEAAAAFDDLTRNKEQLASLTGQSAGDWPNTFRSSRFIPAVEYIRAMRARRLLMQEMDKLMSQYDVFLSPAPGSSSLQVTNLTGHPAIALKSGFIDNMPPAIMVTGRLYDEATVCRVALAYEQATEWHKKTSDAVDVRHGARRL